MILCLFAKNQLKDESPPSPVSVCGWVLGWVGVYYSTSFSLHCSSFADCWSDTTAQT